MKKVAVVTGTRAEYGILIPVLRAIEANPKLQLSLIVTGMHLSPEFGHTMEEIEKDGFKIEARVEMMAAEDTMSSMADSIGRGIIGMAKTWAQLRPDIIMVLGDRVEPLAATISGAYMNIAIAHIHGGDSSKGGLDEYARHAITKFSHIHFPATQRSAERIIKMGEDERRVHMVGSPALDVILNEKLLPAESMVEKLGLDMTQPIIMLTQHPVTTEVDQAEEQITETLKALVDIGFPVIVFYPNSDAGGRAIIEVINQYQEKFSIFKVIPNLPRREYLSLLKIASVLVGNSSSGMIDTPSFGIPVINIGTRQEGRERGNNVIDVNYNRQEIITAVKKALIDREFLTESKRCYNPYGDGKASIRIAEVLSNLKITPALFQKKITY